MDGALAIFEISRACVENREVDPARLPQLSEDDAYFSAGFSDKIVRSLESGICSDDIISSEPPAAPAGHYAVVKRPFPQPRR